MEKNPKDLNIIKKLNIKKENNTSNKCKIQSITNIYIIKLIFKYQNITHGLQIIKLNKSLQKSLGLSLTTYKIFSYYKKNKINMFDFKKLVKFSQNIKSKLKEFSSLDEIYYDLSICMIDNFYSNINLRKNNANIIDINMLYDDLYLMYTSLLHHFSPTFKINLFFSDKFFIDKKYIDKCYDNFIDKNKTFINGISLEIYDKNIFKSIIDNKIVLINNKILANVNITRIKFSKIKFCKDEIKLILELFYSKNISELCFISCKFTLFSIGVLSRYFSQDKNKLTKLIFNDCHINNNALEKIIYFDDKDLEYSLINNILSGIEDLDLTNNKINDLGFNQILSYFNSNNKLYNQKLKYLNLSKNKLGNKSIKYLFNIDNNISNGNKIIFKNLNLTQTEKLIGLTYLDFSHNSLGDIVKLIFSWKNSALTHLILNDCNIRNTTYDNYNKSITNYINIDEDIEEDLDNNEKEIKDDYEYFSDDDLTLGLTNLIYLNISENQLSSKFLKFLFFEIPNLYIILISSCLLENISFKEIFNIKKKVNLEKIIMSHNYIDSKTIIDLYENDIISNVKELDLFDNNLKDEIVPYLISKKGVIKLRKINVDLNFGIEKENNSLLYQNYIRYTK